MRKFTVLILVILALIAIPVALYLGTHLGAQAAEEPKQAPIDAGNLEALAAIGIHGTEKTESDIIDAAEKIEEWPYPITQEEIDLIALVTMGEAEGETELGKRLVIDTVLNRVDDTHFPDTVNGVIFQPNQFSCMWDGRIECCYVMPEIVELVKEELCNRTNSDCIFFMAGEYSAYGTPMFQECCHYFSSYN